MPTNSLIAVKKKLFVRCALALLVQHSASLSSLGEPFSSFAVQKYSCTPSPSVLSSPPKGKFSVIPRPFSHLFVKKKGKTCDTCSLPSSFPARFSRVILSGRDKKDSSFPHGSFYASTCTTPRDNDDPLRVPPEVLSLCAKSALIPLSVFLACCMHHRNTPAAFRMHRAEALAYLQALVQAGSILCYRRHDETMSFSLSSFAPGDAFSWPSEMASALFSNGTTARVDAAIHRPSKAVGTWTTPDTEATDPAMVEEWPRGGEEMPTVRPFSKDVDAKGDREGKNADTNERLSHASSLDGVVTRKESMVHWKVDAMEDERNIFLFLKPEMLVFRIQEKILNRVAVMDAAGRKDVGTPPPPSSTERMHHNGASPRHGNILVEKSIPNPSKRPLFFPGTEEERHPTPPLSSPSLPHRLDQEDQMVPPVMSPHGPTSRTRVMTPTTPPHVSMAGPSKKKRWTIRPFQWTEIPPLHSFRLGGDGGGGKLWKEKPADGVTDGRRGGGGPSCGGNPPLSSPPIPFHLLRGASSSCSLVPTEAHLSHALLSLRVRRQREWATRAFVFSCLLLLMGYGTFIAYGWDVMEPICYFWMSAMSIVWMAAAILRTRRASALYRRSPVTQSFSFCSTPASHSPPPSIAPISQTSATGAEEMAVQQMQRQFADEKIVLQLSSEESVDVWKCMHEPVRNQLEKYSILARWTRWLSNAWRGGRCRTKERDGDAAAPPFLHTASNRDGALLSGASFNASSVSSACTLTPEVLLHFCREKAVLASSLDAPPFTSAACRYSVCSHRSAFLREDGERTTMKTRCDPRRGEEKKKP